MAPTNSGQSQRDDAATGRSSQGAAGNGDSPASTASLGDSLTQALRDLARGEQTAAALEANLTSLESKLDEMLASFGIPLEEDGVEIGDADVPGTRQDAGDKPVEPKKKKGD